MQKPLSSQVWPRRQAGQVLGGGVREEGTGGLWHLKLGMDESRRGSNSVGSEVIQFERIMI